ncbi:MAG: hypothetical protein WBG17_13890 [Burkholderiaceae bacterium]
MKLTEEQKTELTRQLSHPWGAVDLMCDGYRIALRVQQSKALTFRVMTYVNGYFKGEWVRGKNPAPESKFLRKSVRPCISPAKRLKLEKMFGKRRVKNDPYWSGSVTLYLPDWPSGVAAINHLCKVCESVQIAEAVSEQP